MNISIRYEATTLSQMAGELIIANKELAFQNNEKENNAMTHDLERYINELSVADIKIIQ